MATVLDYRNAFFYAKDSTTNKLFIEVDSRTFVDADEYFLLAPHPREQTFFDNGQIYSGMLSAAQGASFITFMIDRTNTKAYTSRRFDYSPASSLADQQSSGASPYGGVLHNPPPEIEATEIMTTPELLAAVDAGKKLVAKVSYTLLGKSIVIEFPIRGVNINAASGQPEGKQWQTISPTVPVFIESSDVSQRLRPGFLAFGRLGPSVSVSMVYLSPTFTPRASQDFSNTLNQTASVQVFALPDVVTYAPQTTIVFAGDSVTQGSFTMEADGVTVATGLDDAQRFSRIVGGARGYTNVINAGKSGSTVASLKARLTADALAHNPDVVAVMIGINDVTAVPTPTPVAVFKSDLSDIVASIQAAGAICILLTPNLIRISVAGVLFPAYLDAIAEVGREKGCGVVPVYDRFCRKFFASSTAEWDALFYDDKHPSAAGHAFMASLISPAVPTAP